MKIAMWSGPRNLSTAMMYSFGNRPDFHVVDEPFYAAYLVQTGLDHPMRDDILASQMTDPKDVIAELLDDVPNGSLHAYHKHMSQHMIETVPRDWIFDMQNVFLIRHPNRVLASFSEKYDNPKPDDLGFRQQSELFHMLRDQGTPPLVIDSADIRKNPRAKLVELCVALGLDFRDEMLHWPAGGHSQDGVWAAHWYGSVHKSTGFSGPEGPLPDINPDMAWIAEELMPFYDDLKSYAL